MDLEDKSKLLSALCAGLAVMCFGLGIVELFYGNALLAIFNFTVSGIDAMAALLR